MKHNRFKDLAGNTYGQWTVLEYAGQVPKAGNYKWKCVCTCGTTQIIIASKLKNRTTTKCKKCNGRVTGRRGLYSQSKNMPVYFIRCGDYVKIGASNDPERRVKDLQGSNPYELELIEVDEDEEFWHKVFERRLHRGEWYEFELPSIEESMYNHQQKFGW